MILFKVLLTILINLEMGAIFEMVRQTPRTSDQSWRHDDTFSQTFEQQDCFIYRRLTIALFMDMNGLFITKKVFCEKLTVQGNVYLIVSYAFIQGAIMEEKFSFKILDDQKRLTVKSELQTQQSSGVTSQRENGEIEV